MHAITCLRSKNDFFHCIRAPHPTTLKANLTAMSNNTLNLFLSNLFCYRKCDFKSTFGYESNTTPLLSVCKKLWTPSSLYLNLTPCVLHHMRYIRLAYAHQSMNFASINTPSKLHQNLVLLFLRQ